MFEKKETFALPSLGGGLASLVTVTVSAASAGTMVVRAITGIGAFVIGAVEAGPLEDHTGSRTDLPVKLVFSARRTAFEGVVLHGLKFFKFVAAAVADISVCRHLRDLSFLISCCLYKKTRERRSRFHAMAAPVLQFSSL